MKIDEFDLKETSQRLSDKKLKTLEQKETIRRLKIQNKKLLEQLAVLRKKINQETSGKNKIAEKLRSLKKLNNALAEALGSCSQCWGEDPKCRNCSGKGIPGWRSINKRLFNVYVLSCLQKLYSINKKRVF